MSDTAHTRADRRNYKPTSPTNTKHVSAPATGLSHGAHNVWSDGTPRSQGNAFDWVIPKVAPLPPTQLEKERAWQREYERKRREMKANATRVNPGSNIAASPGISNSRKAPR